MKLYNWFIVILLVLILIVSVISHIQQKELIVFTGWLQENYNNPLYEENNP